jgi:ABC-type bacteriocin/lantibiotic exporter with double-glycine peptidase domain
MLMMREGNNVRQVVNAEVYTYGASDILGLLVLIGLVVGYDSFSLYLVCKCGICVIVYIHGLLFPLLRKLVCNSGFIFTIEGRVGSSFV